MIATIAAFTTGLTDEERTRIAPDFVTSLLHADFDAMYRVRGIV